MPKNSVSPKKNVTIKDIAKRAGVSQRSVSQALLPGTGKVKVSDATRQRIRSIASAMGYRCNSFARSLRTGESGMLGILCFGNIQYLGAHRLTHCLNEVEAQGKTPFVYHVELHTSERLNRGCEVMINARVDAVLVLQPPTSFQQKHIGLLQSVGLPVATLGGRHFDNVTCFLTDKIHAFELLTQHLIDIGCSDLALLSTALPSSPDKQVMLHSYSAQQGFNRAVRSARNANKTITAMIHQLDLEVAAQNTPTFPHIHGLHAPGYIAIREMIKAQCLPRGLVCQTDQWALGALQACAEANVKVPDDVAITGFDDMPASSSGPVPLTTVAEPLQELSRAAVQHLIQMIKSTEQPATDSALMQGKLIQRRSTTLSPPPPPAVPTTKSKRVPV